MNAIQLLTNAELNAEKAESLKAFSGIKLLHIKKQVASILALIGQNNIFDEYTKHNISHIDYMLMSLDWIIPETTKQKLTPADWLMITLSIYFHDLGMLVTKEEFKYRNKTEFLKFKANIESGELGLDYKDKIFGIQNSEDRDRFIYQELVRKTHAERVKYWILDGHDPKFSSDLTIRDEVKKLLENLDVMFRRDLAFVCESHNLNDLDDFIKYKPDQQYGPSPEEAVNLHYAALILRTADLLHMTSDRTPSIEYKLINPTDPISQEEWAKQGAVKTVRPQSKKNKEGDIDVTIPKDTFEVLALFADEKGFFGLVSYINYVKSQLVENFKFNEVAKKQYATTYEYPWKNIDDSGIQTEDFDKRQFEFVLDQNKILNLLVGHTLYNDSTVVLRELTQNSIDATKLKKFELSQECDNSYVPEIQINWNEKDRELSFIDNGTGMNLEIIENHLLKVGSSRYQDAEFKKKYPDFSPISRFGIGLLTCFLIADDLDIITKTYENDKAILLKIKKVHGKYLLKYLSADKTEDEIKPHGTIIKLFVRSDVNLKNIDDELRKWILFPNEKIKLKINNGESLVGYSSPKALLTNYLSENGYKVDDKSIKVKELSKDGIDMAIALRYIDHWKEWNFLDYYESPSPIEHPIGTCIEGIRVDFNTPGFLGRNLFAVINSSGKNAPKTNVARSNIEVNSESEGLLLKVYQLYLQHIVEEINNIRTSGFSITWAANEINYFLNSLTSSARYANNRGVKLENKQLFNQALSEIKCVLIEQDSKRELVSINDLIKFKHFWTLDSLAYSSANSLIKEVKSSNIAALSIMGNIFAEGEAKTEHLDRLLCNINSNKLIQNIIEDKFQVSAIKLLPDQRRLDLLYTAGQDKIWEKILMTEENEKICYVQLEDVVIDNLKNEIAIDSSSSLFILKNSELNDFVVKTINSLSSRTSEDYIALGQLVQVIDRLFYKDNADEIGIEELIEARFERNNKRNLSKIFWDRVDKEEFISVVQKTKFVKYDTAVWHRRDMYY